MPIFYLCTGCNNVVFIFSKWYNWCVETKGLLMTKAEQFRQAIERLESDMQYIGGSGYMSDMSHWCAVHATKYMPRKNPDGTMYIPSTAMATDFRIPRTTFHVTLNHVVTAHTGGNWNDVPIVVLMPYNDVVKQNGNPAEVAGTDTYWSVNPDTGLVLPESTYIVQPDNDGPLYQIGEHSATYKRDNYTDEEVAQIESLLNPYERDEYMKYKNGEIDQWGIEHEFYGDKRVKQMYDSAKDKKAFLRGLFEEARFNILSQYLRDAVVKMSMPKLHMTWVNGISDGGTVSEAIADTAANHGIDSTASNKGHSGSVYAEMEQCFFNIDSVLNGTGYGDSVGILNASDFSELYDIFVFDQGVPLISEIISNLVENKPIDFAKVYQDEYSRIIKSRISFAEIDVEWLNKEIREDIPSYNCDENRKQELISESRDKILKWSEYIKKLSAKKTIGDYDKNLAETIRRHCKRLNDEYTAWRKNLEKNPEYEKLVQNLRGLVASQNIMRGGRDDF